MLNDRIFLMLGMMMLVPIVFTLLISVGIGDATTATIGTMAINLVMLLWMRKTFKNGLNGLLGTKVKFACLTCGGTKFDPKGTCWKCGGKSRKSI